MKALDEIKIVKMVESVAVGTSAVSGYIDTKGYSDLTVVFNGATAATGGLPSAMKLQHGDTTSAFTDITGAVGGTAATGGFIIPTPNTSAGEINEFRVGLLGKKRYVNFTVTGTATTRVCTVLGILSRPEVVDTTATTTGVSVLVTV